MDLKTPLLVLSLAATGLLLDAGPCAGADRLPCLRVTDRALASAVASGRERSATFRRLLQRIERSDLIVHLGRAREPFTRKLRGFTQFIAVTGGYRFVQVTISNTYVPSDELVALVGHELQHVVEVAEAPEVVDPESYHQLYRTIGYPSCRTRRCYDTRAAVRTGQRVLEELTDGPFADNRMLSTGY